VERGWILMSDEEASHLSALLKRGSKKEVMNQFSIYRKLPHLSVRLCVCLPAFLKMCGPISMKLFVVHRGHM